MADLYFRQLLSGRDFARENPAARQMVNFSYLVGDRQSGEALLVDPAWAPLELCRIAEADGMRLIGVVATHCHPDHVGGDWMRFHIDGVRELLDGGLGVPVHAQRTEAEGLAAVAGLTGDELVLHDDGDVVRVGGIEVTLLHTPGHSAGGQCLLVDGHLLSGDTLFLEGCGRTDLPGSDPTAMFDSITRRLAVIPDDTMLFPGHLYSAEPAATLGETRRTNYVFRFSTLEQWTVMFGS